MNSTNRSTPNRAYQATPFHSYFFRLVDVISLEHSRDSEIFPSISQSYRLIIVSSGSASFLIDDSCYAATLGSCYGIAPGAKLDIAADGGEEKELHYMCMTFDIVCSPLNSSLPLPFAHGEMIIKPFGRMLAGIRKLIAMKNSKSEKDRLSYYFRFQKLMYAILEQNTVVSETTTSMQAVERTVSFLKDHYHEEISTKQLAEQAGLGTKQYIVLFKKITGSTPHEYVTELRIRKAKELLLISRQPLSDIAEQVGFRDSYYFNRRFKQVTGVPPRVYVNTRKYNIMSIDYACALLALGIKPVGAPAYHLGYYARRSGEAISSIGDKSTFYYDKMTALKPDLIISSDTLDIEIQQRLERIAPIVNIPWMGLQATGHLQEIGDLLGVSKQAQSWIDGYEMKRAEAHWRIKPYLNVNETVGLLVIEGEELFVLGDRNAGEVMYRSFGLQPPPLVQSELAKHPNQYGRKVAIEQLWQYEADRLFIIVYGAEAALTYKKLQHNPIWRELSAVRQGKVQTIDPEKWIYYDVLSLSGQLEDGISMLAKP